MEWKKVKPPNRFTVLLLCDRQASIKKRRRSVIVELTLAIIER
jgi:hypothetical protein